MLRAYTDSSQSCVTATFTVYITKTEKMSVSPPPPLQIQVAHNLSMKPRALSLTVFRSSVDILFYHKFLTVYSSCVRNIS